MGRMTCESHGFQPMWFACDHIMDNLRNGDNSKCIEIKLRIIEGNNTRETKSLIGNTRIPFCLRCFEEKKMSEKMKLIDDDKNLEVAIDEYKINGYCRDCIGEYVKRNRIN